MSRISRRRFLKGGLAGGAGLCASAAGMSGCGVEVPYIPLPTDQPVTKASRVAAVRGLDLIAMTREALEGVGGISSIVHPGETVFIKPNYGGLGFVKQNCITSGESVKPEIVVTVAEECLKAGAAKVTIGDAGQARVLPWNEATFLDGSTNLLAEVQRLNAAYPGRIELMSLVTQSPGWEGIPSPHTTLGKVYISNLVTNADRIISIAVIKAHRWTQITGSMKNFVGTTSFDRYGMGIQWRFKLHDTAGGVAQAFLDIVAGIKPDLGIIDGSIICEGNGPHVLPGYWGETLNVRDRLGDWFLLAGTDLAAVDATAARILSLDIAGIDQLQMAYQQGIGQIQEDQIEVVGADLSQMHITFKQAEHTVGFAEVLLPGIALLM